MGLEFAIETCSKFVNFKQDPNKSECENGWDLVQELKDEGYYEDSFHAEESNKTRTLIEHLKNAFNTHIGKDASCSFDVIKEISELVDEEFYPCNSCKETVRSLIRKIVTLPTPLDPKLVEWKSRVSAFSIDIIRNGVMKSYFDE
ncbi:hypothetical protein [Fundidesulfovibrio putealis]|uniref:hypothetical protein n=1 Tax=Fundidesulfovibrio putealis TaxID=270496 RepID=UPI0012EC7436|nr:hypothetical protein [Fundidesulfovibrio putealis]